MGLASTSAVADPLHAGPVPVCLPTKQVSDSVSRESGARQSQGAFVQMAAIPLQLPYPISHVGHVLRLQGCRLSVMLLARQHVDLLCRVHSGGKSVVEVLLDSQKHSGIVMSPSGLHAALGHSLDCTNRPTSFSRD